MGQIDYSRVLSAAKAKWPQITDSTVCIHADPPFVSKLKGPRACADLATVAEESIEVSHYIGNGLYVGYSSDSDTLVVRVEEVENVDPL